MLREDAFLECPTHCLYCPAFDLVACALRIDDEPDIGTEPETLDANFLVNTDLGHSSQPGALVLVAGGRDTKRPTFL